MESEESFERGGERREGFYGLGILEVPDGGGGRQKEVEAADQEIAECEGK